MRTAKNRHNLPPTASCPCRNEATGPNRVRRIQMEIRLCQTTGATREQRLSTSSPNSLLLLGRVEVLGHGAQRGRRNVHQVRQHLQHQAAGRRNGGGGEDRIGWVVAVGLGWSSGAATGGRAAGQQAGCALGCSQHVLTHPCAPNAAQGVQHQLTCGCWLLQLPPVPCPASSPAAARRWPLPAASRRSSPAATAGWACGQGGEGGSNGWTAQRCGAL